MSDPITREQQEIEHFLSRFDEITDALSHLCNKPVVNDGYRLIFALKARIDQYRQVTCPFYPGIAPCDEIHQRLS